MRVYLRFDNVMLDESISSIEKRTLELFNCRVQPNESFKDYLTLLLLNKFIYHNGEEILVFNFWVFFGIGEKEGGGGLLVQRYYSNTSITYHTWTSYPEVLFETHRYLEM